MLPVLSLLILSFSLQPLAPPEAAVCCKYTWLETYVPSQALAIRIPAPRGYQRQAAVKGSFAQWLRNLPMKPGKPPVMLHDGTKKWYQEGHHAVVDLDVGRKDRQQCADAIMRLRGEFLYSKGDFDSISFNYTSQDTPVRFSDWRRGKRPKVIEYKVKGKRRWKVKWIKSKRKGSDYKNFRAYIERIFSYAGTYSLSRELKKVKNINDMEIGDVFIQGGFPGHAILVLDMARNPKTGKKVFMVGQSYMPAQDFHVLKNLKDPKLSPWYPLDFSDTLETPEWVFEKKDLKRFLAPESARRPVP